MRRPPGGDGFVIVAIGHRAADNQKQNLRQWMRHSPGLARILDHREVIEKRFQTRLFLEHGKGKTHGGAPESTHAQRITPSPSR